MTTLRLTGALSPLRGLSLERVVPVVNLVLVIWLAWGLARVAWQLTPAPELPVPPPPATAGPVGATAGAGPAPGELAELHLFGEAERGAAERAPATPVDAPETRLNLVLKGVVSSTEKARGHAIIADPRGRDEAYRPGDQLPGGAELREIYPDRVILLRGGRHETLRLPREREPGSAAPDTAPARGGETGTPMDRLRSYQQSLRTNPGALVGLVRPLPVREEGKLVGFRLLPGKDPELYREIGLLASDVVTEVNGIPLDNPAKGLAVLRSLRSAEQLNLTVKRNGRQIQLAYQLP